MKVRCIENKYNNGNFTLNKVYDIKKDRITCDFIHILLDKPIETQENQFIFAWCKFEITENTKITS